MSDKGRGKVRPRQGAARAFSSGPTLAALSQADIEHGEIESDPKPAYSNQFPVEWAAYATYSVPTEAYKAISSAWSQTPVLLRDSPFLKPTELSSVEPKALVFDNHASVQACCVDASMPEVMECNQARNIYGTPYHVREPKTQMLDMTYDTCVESMAQWTARRLFLRLNVDAADNVPLKMRRGTGGEKMSRSLHDAIDWEWLERWQNFQQYGPCVGLHLDIGTQHIRRAPAYALTDRLVMQVSGRCRVLLFPPRSCFKGMYPFPVHHGYDTFSMISLSRPDLNEHPAIASLAPLRALLRTGDVLHVPAYWFVYTEYLAKDNVQLSTVWAQGTRALPADALAVQFARTVEDRLAALEGPQAVRKWIEALALGNEHEKIDLATVQGYKRMLICESIRDDAEAVLGSDAWMQLLKCVVDRRLLPTSWLNKDFREPLYLTDKPVVYQDDRTEEERRYPELFRQKLEASGWTVKKTESSLPIPGYNVPMHKK